MKKAMIGVGIVFACAVLALVVLAAMRQPPQPQASGDGVLRVEPTILNEKSAYEIGKQVLSRVKNADSFEADVQGTWQQAPIQGRLTRQKITERPELRHYYDLLTTGMSALPANMVIHEEKKEDGDRLTVRFSLDAQRVNGMLNTFAPQQAVGLQEFNLEMRFDKNDGSLQWVGGLIASEKINGEGRCEYLRIYP